jgi:hypothetical protein
MKLGGPVAGAALLLATLGGASAGALLLGTAGADPNVPDEVTTTAAASTGRCGPVLAAVVHAVGVPADELRSELASGATLAQVAEANGVDTQAVVDALVAGGNTRIDTQLANGRLTEAQAERRRATLPDRAAEYVAAPIERDSAPRIVGGGRRGAMRLAADAIGVPRRELRAELDAGRTLAEVAADHGVDPEAVVDAILSRTRARVTTLVNGGNGQTTC